ncbi:DNA repair protein RecO [Jiella sp. MQZ9-1]|uniref:DNA repair protein RecO n=1 Tax=Jiella flava TaxID=2816857 RepID=A0A939FYI5_9HYPH|nr:DNA repair protein RecO [Jiella flava]MBO0663219.1 DNA repair protein RecO [Jiella flava]MCD2471794.1 DNA repair protein RecO [Jiella flava]
MEWREEAIVLGVRRHGESSVIAEVMTRARGRHLGIVRGGRSRHQQPVLQPGNTVAAHWRARLHEHMGTFVLEPVTLRAATLIESAAALNAIQLAAAHLRLLPERDPHPRLFDGLAVIIEHLAAPQTAAALMLRFEIALLEELGFGLDLSQCAATGQSHDLVYVSPKTGRAVSREAGAPWHDKLLKLPAFLVEAEGEESAAEIAAAFQMTGYFLARNVFDPRGIKEPESRLGLLAALAKGPATPRASDADRQ